MLDSTQLNVYAKEILLECQLKIKILKKKGRQ